MQPTDYSNQPVKVSIIITNYNLQQYVGTAIRSLLDQRCSFNFEIIVIDDASTDDSVALISSIREARVRLIALPKNGGAANAINIAYEQVKGEYVCRFDADDKWYPDYLQRAAAILDAHPDVVLVHSDVSFIDQHDTVTSERNNIGRPAFLQPADYEFEYILRQYYMNAPAIMARKSAWDKVLPWQERFRTGLGDWFCALGIVQGEKSYFINEPLAYYRIHTTNMHRAMIKDHSAEANTAWILDHFSKQRNDISGSGWKEIRFEQSRHLGFAYLFHDMHKDAQRCLTRALKYKPSALLNSAFMRAWVASLVGKKWYNKMKFLLAPKAAAQS